jgi:hypothetical protein
MKPGDCQPRKVRAMAEYDQKGPHYSVVWVLEPNMLRISNYFTKESWLLSYDARRAIVLQEMCLTVTKLGHS